MTTGTTLLLIHLTWRTWICETSILCIFYSTCNIYNFGKINLQLVLKLYSYLLISRPSDYRHNPAINALDLENLDLRNIDPVLASKLLDEIRCGADVRPLLEKLKRPMLSGI